MELTVTRKKQITLTIMYSVQGPCLSSLLEANHGAEVPESMLCTFFE